VSLFFVPIIIFNHFAYALHLILMGPIKVCLVLIIIPCQPRFYLSVG
jgi:hypothetical protein